MIILGISARWKGDWKLCVEYPLLSVIILHVWQRRWRVLLPLNRMLETKRERERDWLFGVEEICVCSSPQQGKFSQRLCKWLTVQEPKLSAIFPSPGEIRPSHPAPGPIRRRKDMRGQIQQSWMGQGLFIYLWEESRRGTTMLIPTRKYSSLVFEVGSLSAKQLLTSCEQTVPRPHSTGAERQRASWGAPVLWCFCCCVTPSAAGLDGFGWVRLKQVWVCSQAADEANLITLVRASLNFYVFDEWRVYREQRYLFDLKGKGNVSRTLIEP